MGYGEVAPTTDVGRIMGGAEMVLGISFIAFLTAGVPHAVIQRGQAKAAEDERRREEPDLRTIVDALTELRTAIGGSYEASRHDRIGDLSRQGTLASAARGVAPQGGLPPLGRL